MRLVLYLRSHWETGKARYWTSSREPGDLPSKGDHPTGGRGVPPARASVEVTSCVRLVATGAWVKRIQIMNLLVKSALSRLRAEL